MIKCDEIKTAMDIVSTKKTNTIPRNISGTTSINYHGKKVRDSSILYSFISDHVTIDNYYCLVSLCKTKRP